MNRTGRAAGSLSAIAGGWAVAFGFIFPSASACPPEGCPIATGVLQLTIPVIGVVLVINGLVCLYGFRFGFPLSGVLSAVNAGLVLYEWAGQNPGLFAVGLVLVSLVAVIWDLLAIRAKSGLSEQNNPMNLPVFG